MRIPDHEIPRTVERRFHGWLSRWGTPSLKKDLRIEFSPRLRRAFGRCYQDEQLIRLAPSLKTSQSYLLPEILCHEAAHAAVYELHGPAARPHGKEWEELMRMAGFEPRVRIPVVVRQHRELATDRVVYLHHCPACDHSRHASRPMHRWRCRVCVDRGQAGKLVIRSSRTAAERPSRSRTMRRERRRAAASVGSPAETPTATIGLVSGRRRRPRSGRT